MSIDVAPVQNGVLREVLEVVPGCIGDDRGFFSEIYNKADLANAGIECEFVQDNHSLSAEVGTIRGLHFQLPPFAQAKLVRVVRGAIFDVAVDIRRSSPTFGRHVSLHVSTKRWNQIYVPRGFAHGFCTTEPNTEVIYKVDAQYSRDHERGVSWNDSDLAIEWPLDGNAPHLSAKDQIYPQLKDQLDLFA